MEDTKRTKIVDAATKVFAEKGYHYATMSEIAKEAGMSTGLIYSYFENKLDILLSIIRIFWKKINRLNQDKFITVKDPLDKILIILQNFEDLLIKDEKALCQVKVLNEALPHIFMIKDKRLQEKRYEIILNNKELIDTIDEIITDGQKKGIFDDSLNPSVLRQVLCGTIERVIYGLFFKTYSGEDIGYDADDAHKAIVKLIEKFILK